MMGDTAESERERRQLVSSDIERKIGGIRSR